ncbi:LAQU0S17e02278g1_1 [Lachancea quebecensis]|uniref:LAQU0S17e02278g1_1 n=1 Tax=Lachancea quebecensis TaxID=1654605 RepID=A0A0P1KX69_9SACH|nr:LAQU0S17e02278g1_1 [Lachancea quebecensis]
MNSTLWYCEEKLYCGERYNLTLASNTSVIEGWYCGIAARTNVDNRKETLPSNVLTVNCTNQPDLDLFGNATLYDGYMCGLGSRNVYAYSRCSNTKLNGASSLTPRWSQLFIFISLFVYLFA